MQSKKCIIKTKLKNAFGFKFQYLMEAHFTVDFPLK